MAMSGSPREELAEEHVDLLASQMGA